MATKTIEQTIGLPSKGAKRPSTTVAEHLTPDMNAWVSYAEKMFNVDGKKWHFTRVHKKGSGQEYDGQVIAEYEARGYQVLFDPETGTKWHRKGMPEGYEAQKCVGNPNYVLMGIPFEVYVSREWDRHERTNSTMRLPIETDKNVSKVISDMGTMSGDEFIASMPDRDDK